jgi:cellulose synthase/poly-beta-1,6-N-acetylglucosamine synthase-like glycosyltransferase
MEQQKTKKLFYSLFTGIYLTTMITFAIFVIKWNHVPSVLLFLVLSFLFFLSSYGIAREITSLLIPYRPPASLSRAPTGIRVALLYTTMNDVVEECLCSLKQTYPVDVFVLDDSTDKRCRALVDSISSRYGYTVVRREKRRGYKAGAVNDWFNSQGAVYDYIVLLDADSYLPPDWVAEALRFAEHPENRRVAIFQGMINIWNLDTDFVSTLAPMSRVGQFVWERQLANDLDAVFCYGHNAMIRVSALREIGGFIEGYVSEDFATAIALADRGWKSKFLPLHTYEAMPENLRGFIKRQNKWTRGAMEFFGLSAKSRLSRGQKLHLLHIPLGHITNLLLPIGMILTVYGFSSTQTAAAAFLLGLVKNPLLTLWSVPVLRFMMIFAPLSSIPGFIVKRISSISFMQSMKHRILSSAISAVSIPFEFKSMLSYLFTGLRTIPVTPKSEAPLTGSEILRISAGSLVIQCMLWTGIYISNPLAALFNSTWLIPMAISPFIIMRFGGIRSYKESREGTRDAYMATCLLPDPAGVHLMLKRASSGDVIHSTQSS